MLTIAQISAIIGLLMAFGVDQPVVNNVQDILEAKNKVEVPAVDGVGAPTKASIVDFNAARKDFCLYHVVQKPQGGVHNITPNQITSCNSLFGNTYWNDHSLWDDFDIHFSSSTNQ